MGITGIWEHMTKQLENVNIDDLRNKTLSIDGHIWLFESLEGSSRFKKDGTASCLTTFFQRCQRLREKKIEPLIIFDCYSREPTDIDANCWNSRKRNRNHLFISQSFSSTRYHTILFNVTSLLDALGVCWLEAKMDGEAQCAYLEQIGLTQGCVTSDFDYFLFGGSNLYKIDFGNGSKTVVSNVRHLSIEMIKTDYHLTRSRLITMAMLLGCDYYRHGVGKAGFVTALEIIAEFTEDGETGEDDTVMILDRFVSYCTEEVPERPTDSIKKRKLRKKKFEFTPGFPNSEEVLNSVRIYTKPSVFQYNPTPKKNPNMAELKRIMIGMCQWSEDRFAEETERSERKKTKFADSWKQPKITNFFSITKKKTVNEESKISFGSKREGAAMKNLKRKSIGIESNSVYSSSLAPPPEKKRSSKFLLAD